MIKIEVQTFVFKESFKLVLEILPKINCYLTHENKILEPLIKHLIWEVVAYHSDELKVHVDYIKIDRA